MFKIEVYCQLDFEALHNFPNAGKYCNQEYLKYSHRHIFRVKCSWEASHANREREFIDVQHEVKSYLNYMFPLTTGNLRDLGSCSCEALALTILEKFEFLNSVEVSEDGENGAIVKRSS